MIHAPYDFVPLNTKVFYPNLDKQVSHDIPFSDGESGEIEIEIKAIKPIFIRNSKVDDSNDTLYYEVEKDKKVHIVSTEFCYYRNANGGKEFYIPGSSLGGTVKKVLRVLSFSRMQLDTDKLGKVLNVRDMTPKKYCLSGARLRDCPDEQKKDLFSHDMYAVANGIGLLRKENGKYILDDYSYMNNNQSNIIKMQPGQIHKEYPQYKKNNSFADKKRNFNNHHLPKIKISTPRYDRYAKANLAKYQKDGKESMLVFNDVAPKKEYEFIIREEDKKTNVKINDEVISQFEKAYFEADSEQGKYWKEYLDNRESIPVFLKKSKKNKILAVGLSQLFKLPCKKTLLDAAKQDSIGGMDLAQTMFGTIGNNLQLKTRVQFGHLKASLERYDAYQKSSPKKELLAEPKPTYYPNYLKQDGKNGKVTKYQTLMDDNAVISGWKFYSLKEGEHKSTITEDNANMATQFKPLGAGTTFRGKIRYHNLKKAELGALLSALTFHGQSSTHHHALGMGKPLGYGEIEITIKNICSIPNKKESSSLTKENVGEYLDSFENLMNSWQERPYTTWKESQQVTEIFAMFNVDNRQKALQPRGHLYQLLEAGNKKVNEFSQSKKNREYLKLYSKFFNQPTKDSSTVAIQTADLPKGTKYRYDKMAKG